ncbi:uncharacterized protein N7446_006820 [Penicillium canescens]|uniref:uncharacterized protein n=1 Tax=Penicillium canescens TaxID=5083 RepID=UPI0026E05CC6|nr:uncharacterized protein N7446_006820 [Penicillium canescens]KAJ6062700.1 hypothetical protein N7446_006820 [Penicillium canescens]
MRFIWITAALVAGCAGAPLTSPMDPNGDVTIDRKTMIADELPEHANQALPSVSDCGTYISYPTAEDEDTFRPSDRRQGGPCERWRCYQQHLLPSLMLDRSIDRHDEKSETELGLRLDTEATEDDGGW